MKKLGILLLTLLMLTACTNKWKGNTSNIPAEVLAQHQALLDENLAKLDEDPNDANATFEVAYRYEMLGEFKDAETYYLKTIKIDPNNFVAVNNLMNLYVKVKEYGFAGEMAKELFNLKPTDVSVLQDVVEVFLLADDSANATLALEYYSKELGQAITPEQQQLVSDLYQSILDHDKANEKK